MRDKTKEFNEAERDMKEFGIQRFLNKSRKKEKNLLFAFQKEDNNRGQK